MDEALKGALKKAEETMPVEYQEWKLATHGGALTERALSLPERAKSISITDNTTYLEAGEVLKDIKALRGEIDSTFDPIIKAANEAHKVAVGKKKAVEAPIIEAEGIIKRGILAYSTEQERLRKAKEDRLREEARKIEEDRKLAEAVHAEEIGNSEEAEAILEEEVYVPPPVLPRAVPIMAGVSVKEKWVFEVVNAAIVPREFLKLDEVKIGQRVRETKGKTNIPGIRAYNEGSVAGRV